jgi:hypothetical protein
MLVSPAGWSFAVPGVTTTEAFNQHFIRDIGIVFLFLSAAFLAGARFPAGRVALWAARRSGSRATPCSMSGKWRLAFCGPSALLRDFPAVSLAALFVAALTLWANRDRRTP